MADQHKGNMTKGVQTLLGDPKKAVIKLSVPMIIGMAVQTIYNLADAIWVSGVSAEALSAVGFFFPFMMMGISLAVGIGIGGGTAISRRIGQKKPEEADQAATYTIILMLAATVIYMAPLLLFIEPIFRSLGSNTSITETLTYARIMFAGTLVLFFSNIANAILRSEGDANRAMIALTIGAGLNIILDPIFIYSNTFTLPLVNKVTLGFGLGIAGAAYATVLSMTISSLILFYWLFIQKKTYVTVRFKGFRANNALLYEIFKVGAPSTIAQLSMSAMSIFLTFILTTIGGDDGVAIYFTGWRVVSVAILPILGMGTAVTAISGAAFGAKAYNKLSITHSYAIKIAIIIEIILAAVVFVFAPFIVKAFTWSEETARLAEPITHMLQIMWIFFPAAAGGILSGAMFQGVGKGLISLIITIGRTLVFAVPLAVLFAIVFKFELTGVYIGLICASWISSLWGFIWARRHISFLKGGNTIAIKQAEAEA
ncbi:MAG: MATE family efflux transporter [Spirochaetales bacterium]|nr:MATE family efflux transporter [Spirochaetales bacterium]